MGKMSESMEAGVEPRRLAGRPTDEEKTKEILAAARQQFVSRGFDATTIESIAEAAGVSKVTVYKRFGSKTGLFASIAREVVGRMEEAVKDLPAGSGDLRERLIISGVALMKSVVCKEIIAMDHLLALESERHPDLAHALFNAGGQAALERLTALFKNAGAVEGLDLSNPEIVAQDLLSLWFGFEWEAIRLNVRPIPDDAWFRSHVERCVDRVWRAYRS